MLLTCVTTKKEKESYSLLRLQCKERSNASPKLQDGFTYVIIAVDFVHFVVGVDVGVGGDAASVPRHKKGTVNVFPGVENLQLVGVCVAVEFCRDRVSKSIHLYIFF